MSSTQKNKTSFDYYCDAKDLLYSVYNSLNKRPVIKPNLKNKTFMRSNALAFLPKKFWFIFSFLFLTSSCSKSQNVIETFTIKQGSHYSYHAHKIVGNALKYDVLFENSCAYDLGNVNQNDINKLFGFNAYNSLHHENSARFGWVYKDSLIEIYAYIYENSTRYFEKIANVKLNKWNTFELQNTGTAYVFKVNESVYIYEKDLNCVTKYNYMLYPYFGGNEVAPHDITIQFKSE